MEPTLFDQPTEAAARELIESQGLRFESGCDQLLGLYDNGELVACAGRAGYVLKMVAIAPSHQGADLLGTLVTGLIQSGQAAGHSTLFVFTRPQTVSSFEALNFRRLVSHGTAALLEYGPGLPAYLASHAAAVRPGRNGAIVMNGNPFTLGHLALVEWAAAQVEHLYLFMVSEDCSVFPFAVRLRLAQLATAHIGNLTILETSRYAVSAGTFPSYFLKRLDQAAEAQMRLDVQLFAERIAPAFHVTSRFAGEEPLCPTTAAYNQVMAEVLGDHAIRWRELPRVERLGAPVSATRVRAAFLDGRWEELQALVPPSTFEFLRSPEARPIRARLETQLKGV